MRLGNDGTRRSANVGTRPPSSSDAGTTLVELLVGITMSAVVGTMAIMFMMTTLDGTRQADGENEQAAAARAVLQSWSMLMRLAVDRDGSAAPGKARFLSLTPVEARFCLALGTKGTDPTVIVPPRGVTLKLDGGRLVEQRWATCEAMVGGAMAQTTRYLAPRATQVTNFWLITPYKAGGLPSATSLNAELIATNFPAGSTPLGADDLGAIVAVQLAFQTQPDPLRPAAAGTYSTVITLPIGS